MRLGSVRRRTVSAAAVVTVPVVLAVLALVNPGFPLARVDLNDGGVWLTATSQLKLGRFNTQVEELNSGLVTTGTRFDVLQDAGDVLLVEPGTVSVVDPASVTLVAQVPVPGGASASMGGGTVAVLDSGGNAWVRPFAALDALRVSSDQPDLELGDGGRVVVTRDGVALGVDGTTGDVTRVRLEAGTPVVEPVGSFGTGVETLTAVGDEPVGLDGSTLVTLRGEVELDGDDLVLQQPGPAADDALVASRTALLRVPLGGGDPVERLTGGSGRPAAPVRVRDCAHAAWASATGSYLRECGGSGAQVEDLEGMSAQDELTFRVNRGAVVLNDTLRGRVWMPLEDTALREPNWEDIVPEEELEEEQEDADGTETTQDLVAECGTQSAPPTAQDDGFGVRPGRATILPVIDNDSSSDCGILAVSEFDPVPEEFGRLEAIYGGRSLQLTVAPDATGSATFTYTITDGRGTSAPSTASVTLTVRDDGVNEAPAQVRTGSMRVEQGAQATYNALADFADPDGDDLVLVGAVSDGGGVSFRQDGSVTFRAEGGALGRNEVRLTVTDGVETAEGVLEVDVRAAGSLAPQVDPVHVVTYVDLPALVQPLAAVRSSSAEPVRLAGVDEVAGLTITTDLAAGTFTVSAARPGTYYVPFVVAAPPQQATGLARVDVREWPSEVQPPVAVRDRAYLPAGGEVTVDPLANDIDPAGGVLVVQSVEAPADSGLRVAVIGHQLVQISATRTLDAPVSVRYVVSNGTTSATSEIAVHPVPPSATNQPPVVANVEVSVRTGGVVTVPVLEDAYDPDGDRLTLVPELAEPLGDGQGLLFVSGDVLRYQAPESALTAHATFAVRDALGNTTAATLTVRVHESDATTKAPPRPRDLTARVFESETIRIPVPLVGIDDDGDGVTLLGAALAPTKGRIVDVGADWLEYEALPGELGTDTFTYAVEDWVGQRAVATIRVGISPRPTTTVPVVARDDAVQVRPGERVEVRVLANDVDPNGGELSLETELEMAEGVDARVEGRRILVQAPDEPGVLQIVYSATNIRGGRATAVLTVTVSGDATVLPPIAQDVVVPPIDTIGRESVEVDVLEVAQNPSGPLSDLEVSVPSSASEVATVTAQGNVVVTLVDHAQTVPYLLTNVSPQADRVSAYAFITVPALGFFPPTPRPKAPELRVASGEPLEIPLDEQVQVAPGRTASIADPAAVTATKSDGTALVKDATTLRFQSAAGYAGPASITVPVTDRTSAGDANGRTSVITLSITVYALDDHPPTFEPTTLDMGPGEAPLAVDLRALTRGPEGETTTTTPYTYQLTSAVPAGFTAALEGSTLRVSAARTTPKGTLGALAVKIGYGRSGSMDTQVDLRVTASTRSLARVLDRTVPDGVQGRETVVNVLENAVNPFPDGPLTVVGAVVETPGAGTTSATSSTVSVRPGPDFQGTMVTRFRVRDATGDPDREVEGRITVSVRGKPETPRAPRVVEVRDRTVVLAWDAPGDRGAPVTGYRVVANPGGAVRACASTTCTIDNLTNDTEYTFTVAAQNAVDWSDPSPASAPARPDAVPDPPGAPVEVATGDRELTVRWDAPRSTGSPITSYTLEITPAPTNGPASVTTSTLTQRFTGLQNGTAYTVRVRAQNRAPEPSGWGPSSATIVPAKAPDAPVVAAQRVETPLGGQINVSWAPPASTGGDAVRAYELTISGPSGGTYPLSASTLAYAFTQAANGYAHEFRVRAQNKAGWSDAGSVTVSTYGVPGATSGVRAVGSGTAEPGQGTVTLSGFSADANGSPITGYEVLQGASVVAAGSGQIVVGALPGGVEQTFQVRACNIAGCGAPSAVVTATPVTKPVAPDAVSLSDPTRDDNRQPTSITASWGATGSWGGGGNQRYHVVFLVDGRVVRDTTVTGTSDTLTNGLPRFGFGNRSAVVSVSVSAVTGAGESGAASADKRIERASEPGDASRVVVTLEQTGARVEATWNAPSDNGGVPLTGYVVEVRVGNGSWAALGTVTSSAINEALPGAPVAAGTEVRIRVKATNQYGESAGWAEGASSVPEPPAPPPPAPGGGG
ncbi:Ig-like domain-containing protein [Cellulomonas sp. NPDC055163]